MEFKVLKNLCAPALAYLVLSIVSLLSLLRQNMSDSRQFCLGELKCDVPHIALVWISQILYIGFWTWILNSICRAGYMKTAWLVFFLPIVMFFVAAVAIMVYVTLDH
jgi:hypothetical protein